MSDKCVCGLPEPCTDQCKKHERVLHGYLCEDCLREWREARPRTAAAIAHLASGKGSVAALRAARKGDAEAMGRDA